MSTQLYSLCARNNNLEMHMEQMNEKTAKSSVTLYIIFTSQHNELTLPSCCIVFMYISSFSTFFLNLITCSTSLGLTSLGQPPSVWFIPLESVSYLSVFTCTKENVFQTYPIEKGTNKLITIYQNNFKESKNIYHIEFLTYIYFS